MYINVITVTNHRTYNGRTSPNVGEQRYLELKNMKLVKFGPLFWPRSDNRSNRLNQYLNNETYSLSFNRSLSITVFQML